MNAKTPATTKTLAHGQEIRVAGFRYAQRIEVVTLMGNYIDSTRKGYHEIRQTWEEVKARDLANGGHLVWTYQAPAVLTANYPGKAEAMAAAAAATARAPEITHGERVTIEGMDFLVHVNGERFQDPVAFRPAPAATEAGDGDFEDEMSRREQEHYAAGFDRE